MKEKSITERRRIVYSALAKHFREDRLFEALWLWEQKYATTNSLEIRKFVSEIVSSEDTDELKSRVYRSLTKATYFSIDSELLPDPYEEMQRYRERVKDSFKYIDTSLDNVAVSFATVVFEQVLTAFLAQMKRKNSVDYENMLHQFKERLAMLEGEAIQKLELKNWLNKKTNALKLHYSEYFMRSLVNELYVLCCERYGPVVADRLLAASIDSASGIEEARHFDPRRLL